MMPGMATMPTTFIWLSVGISAMRMHLRRAACVASHLLAPSASSSSIRSLPAKKTPHLSLSMHMQRFYCPSHW